jgi:hypothetical protein
MSGLSINSVNISSLTYAGQTLPDYTSEPGKLGMKFFPGYYRQNDNKLIQDKVVIPAYINGRNDRTDTVDIVCWGKLAQTICKSLTPGRNFHVKGRLESYKSTLYNADGSVRNDAAGQPITVRKHSIVVEPGGFVFGSHESPKFIEMELAKGRRPQGWDIKGHQNYEAWRKRLADRAAIVFSGGATFGYAQVRTKQGLNYAYANPGMAQNAAAGQATPPAADNSGVQNYVSETLGNTADAGQAPAFNANTPMF